VGSKARKAKTPKATRNAEGDWVVGVPPGGGRFAKARGWTTGGWQWERRRCQGLLPGPMLKGTQPVCHCSVLVVMRSPTGRSWIARAKSVVAFLDDWVRSYFLPLYLSCPFFRFIPRRHSDTYLRISYHMYITARAMTGMSSVHVPNQHSLSATFPLTRIRTH